MPPSDNPDERENLTTELTELRDANKQYSEESKRIGLVFAKVNKLLRTKQQLASFREPVVLLERRNGTIEFYEGVKAKRWEVPGRTEGEETEIHFNTPPKRISYGKQWFSGYYCHEDYAYPIDLGYNIIKTKEGEFKVNLRAANVNGEALRDLMRKVLVAWERYKTTAKTANLKAWGKIILYIVGGLAGIYFMYKFFGQSNPEATQSVVDTAKNVISDPGIVIRGG